MACQFSAHLMQFLVIYSCWNSIFWQGSPFIFSGQKFFFSNSTKKWNLPNISPIFFVGFYSSLLMTIHSNRKTQSKFSTWHWCIKIFNQRAFCVSMWLKYPSIGSYNFMSSWRVHFASKWLHNIRCHSKQCKYFHSCYRYNKAPQKPSNFIARLDFLESHQRKFFCSDPRSTFRRTRTIRLH